MTALLFRDDAYRRECQAKVIGLDESGIILEQTIFYPTAGGQPGDAGTMITAAGPISIGSTIYDAQRQPLHVPREGQNLPAVGETVQLALDWDSRYRNMRCHSLMHLLCAAVPYPVTGSAISADGGRIDFDIPDGEIPDKAQLADKINGWISQNHQITTQLITEAELDAKPELVRTMFVKPPRGAGVIRLVLIGKDGAVDLQPCGGTHVNETGEIGPIAVTKIENKGKINRRIRVAFA
jgi:misacylated tRNA(Ala) deacylase